MKLYLLWVGGDEPELSGIYFSKTNAERGLTPGNAHNHKTNPCGWYVTETESEDEPNGNEIGDIR